MAAVQAGGPIRVRRHDRSEIEVDREHFDRGQADEQRTRDLAFTLRGPAEVHEKAAAQHQEQHAGRDRRYGSKQELCAGHRILDAYGESQLVEQPGAGKRHGHNQTDQCHQDRRGHRSGPDQRPHGAPRKTLDAAALLKHLDGRCGQHGQGERREDEELHREPEAAHRRHDGLERGIDRGMVADRQHDPGQRDD